MLTTREAGEMLGLANSKILALIESRKLRAVDISCGDGKRPRWGIPADAVYELLSGEQSPLEPKAKKSTRRQRIDNGVPKVFG
ncbi:hypothetical protein SH139x_002218 [Planctomycetaceae bacterium SH139]